MQDREDSILKHVKVIEGMLEPEPKEIVFTLPDLLYSGGVANIIHTARMLSNKGHKIRFVLDQNLMTEEVVDMTYDASVITVSNSNFIPTCDILVVHSDSLKGELYFKEAKADKKYLFKLGHMEEDVELANLKFKWDGILTTTPMMTRLAKRYGVSNVYEMGWYHFDHPLFYVNPESKSVWNNDPPVIGFVGSDRPKKHTNALLYVASELPELKFKMFGNCNKKAPDNVEHIRSLDRESYAEEIKKLDIWIDYSELEGIGRCFLEAMSACVYIIARQHVSDVLKEYEFTTSVDNLIYILRKHTDPSPWNQKIIKQSLIRHNKEANEYYRKNYLDYMFKWDNLLSRS